MTRAAPVMRAVTIAPGLQPLASSAWPKVPDEPKVAADASATSNPTKGVRCGVRSAAATAAPDVMGEVA